MILTFGKYKGKDISEIPDDDVDYLIRLYWEIISTKRGNNRFQDSVEIEKGIHVRGKNIFSLQNEILKTITFGKYKGKTFEEIIDIDSKYIGWIYNINIKKVKLNKKLINTLEYWMKKNGCKLFIGNKYEYCESCKTKHLK